MGDHRPANERKENLGEHSNILQPRPNPKPIPCFAKASVGKFISLNILCPESLWLKAQILLIRELAGCNLEHLPRILFI